MFGPLFFPIAVWTAGEARKRGVRWKDVALWALTIVLGLLVFLLLVVLVHPQGRFYLNALQSGGPIPGLESVPDAPRLIAERLQERFLFPWTALLLTALLTTAGLALWRRTSAKEASAPCPPFPASSLLRPASFVLLLVAAGAALTLAVEFFYLRDHFGTRMNTVFKFYFQAWTMWGVAAAYALARFWLQGSRWATWIGALLVFLGLVYPALAIPTRGNTAAHPRWTAQPTSAPFTGPTWPP